jgi:hypothetical protein
LGPWKDDIVNREEAEKLVTAGGGEFARGTFVKPSVNPETPSSPTPNSLGRFVLYSEMQ